MRFPDDFEFIPLKNSPIGNARKEPAFDGWRTDPPLSRQAVREIFRLGRNYGVRLRSCDLVVDIDPRNGGDESMLGFDTSKYPTVLTPSGGKHLYMTKPPDFKIHHTVKCFPGIEFKTLGRQVVGPGSTHPNGGKYAFDDIFAPPFAPGGAPLFPDVLAIRIKMEDVIPTGHGVWTDANLEAALSHLDPVDYSDHDEWLSIMMASHEATGGTGEDVFTAWSLRDPRYSAHEKIIRSRWQSLKSGKAGNAGAGTIRHLLVEAGVQDIGIDTAEEEFSEFVKDNPPPPDTPITAAKVNPYDKLNSRFLAVQEDGKLRVLELRNDDAMNVLRWVRHGKKDFLEVAQSVYHLPSLVRKQKTKEGDKVITTPIAKLWIENPIPGKQVYPGGTVFAPEIDAQRVGESLNLWRGFQYEPRFEGDWSLLSDLVLNVLCRGNETSYNYVLDWMARAVQKPHIPGGVAVVFKGIKGTGKGTLGRTFIKLFGTHGLHVVSSEHITGRFNIQLMDCIAMFADEAYWAGDRASEGAFKGLITEPTKLYEAKGLTPRMARNLIHMMVASNNDWVIPAGLDGERRFAMFETTDEVRPKEFFQALHAQLEDGGYEALMWDLVHRDITTFWPQDFPNTEALAQQKIEGMDHVEQWLFELLDTGNWGGLPIIELKDPLGIPESYILAHDFQASFVQYLAHRKSGRAVQTQVGITLKKFIPALEKMRIDRPETRIDISTMRPWAYRLCDMETARAGFVKAIGRDLFN